MPSIDLIEAASFCFILCLMELFSRSHRELTLELDSDLYTWEREANKDRRKSTCTNTHSPLQSQREEGKETELTFFVSSCMYMGQSSLQLAMDSWAYFCISLVI